MPLIALTGGPGAGKTAVIAALRERGHDCMPESARAIIRERLKGGFSPRPLAREFAEKVLQLDIQQYARVAGARQPVFFDRCILDALSMIDQLRLLTIEHQTFLANYPYFRTAFSFPPWEEIYATDAERDQTFAEAIVVYEAVTGWYRKCGYDLVEVPRGTVRQRCDFILRAVT
jgi:predicted ATPase